MKTLLRLRVSVLLGALLLAAGLGLTGAAAQPIARPLPQAAPLHPQFALLDASGYRIINIDAVVLAEAPKIMPFRREMSTRLLAAMRIAAPLAFNLKATTTEGCGMLGRGEGIGAMATALIARRPPDRNGAP